MKKYIQNYGLLSATILIAANLLFFAIVGPYDSASYGWGEVFGYAVIIASLLVIFFAVRHYRDHVQGGTISFGAALKLGVLITLIPALAFALYNYVYVEFLDPQFMDNYYAHMLEEAQASMSASDYEVYLADHEKNKGLFMNVGFQCALMFVTVLLIGAIFSCVFGLILKRNQPSVAA